MREMTMNINIASDRRGLVQRVVCATMAPRQQRERFGRCARMDQQFNANGGGLAGVSA